MLGVLEFWSWDSGTLFLTKLNCLKGNEPHDRGVDVHLSVHINVAHHTHVYLIFKGDQLVYVTEI